MKKRRTEKERRLARESIDLDSIFKNTVVDNKRNKVFNESTNITTCSSCATGGNRSLTVKNDQFLTTQEAADFLRLSTQSLLNMVSAGNVQVYKLGSRNRYLLSDLYGIHLLKTKGD